MTTTSEPADAEHGADVEYDPSAAKLVGTILDGRYRVLAPLGSGGTGIVFEAEHVLTGRRVALKLLVWEGELPPRVKARFEREARAAGALGHPNIVEVLDASTTEGGQPFIVMELVEGESLAAHLARVERVSLARTAEIVRAVADALDALHAIGIVHRDVKPENLVLTPDGGVKLLDFGLAAFQDARHGRPSMEGMISGTPEYMPPEVFSDARPTMAGDVYALATVAYELLTGRVPFLHENRLATLYEKSERDAPPLSECFEAPFPRALEAVIARGLARDPAKRYASAGAFATALAERAREAPLALRGSWPAPAPPRLPLGLRLPPSDAPRTSPRWLVALALGTIVAGAGGWLTDELFDRPDAHAIHVTEVAPAPVEIAPAVDHASAPLELPSGVDLHSVDVHALEAPEPVLLAETWAPRAQPSGEARSRPEPRGESDARQARRARRSATTARATEDTAATAPAATEPAATEDTAATEAASTERGLRALVRGRLHDAARLLRAATREDRDAAAAWRGLGLAHERLGEPERATRAYRRYLSLAPGAPDASEVRRRVDALSRGG